MTQYSKTHFDSEVHHILDPYKRPTGDYWRDWRVAACGWIAYPSEVYDEVPPRTRTCKRCMNSLLRAKP